MTELLLRFVIGGTFVSLFALIADLLRPKSFGGLFGAAPSIALASLLLTVSTKGVGYASVEARTMVVGALALFVYAHLVMWALCRRKTEVLWTTAGLLIVWLSLGSAFWALERLL